MYVNSSARRALHHRPQPQGGRAAERRAGRLRDRRIAPPVAAHRPR